LNSQAVVNRPGSSRRYGSFWNSSQHSCPL